MSKYKKQLLEKLDCIEDEEVRDFTEFWLTKRTPDYFFEVPASSTGKYHPPYALGEGGLVRHTIAAMSIAHSLLDPGVEVRFTAKEKDLIKGALALHDTRKHGFPEKSKYTNASHGKDLADVLHSEYPEGSEPYQIANLVASHSGQWNKSYTSDKVVAPKPETAGQHFVHMCDYLASRKFIEINFEECPI